MAQAQTLDIAGLIDSRRVDAFNWSVIILSFFIILFDGYDISAIAFAGPLVARAWGVSNIGLFMGTVFGASLVGMLFGAPLIGYFGDRFGRKTATIVSSLFFGVLTLACCWATSLEQLRILRFFVGLGIGGMMPNLIALNAEFAQRRYRASMVIIMFCGVTLGGAVPGWIAISIVPHFGWQALFAVGGVLPIIMAIVAYFWLPESLKYLVVQGKRAAAARLVQRLAPGTPVSADTQFIIADEGRQSRSLSPHHLFKGGLAFITPLLWLCFATNLAGFYFMVSWTPTILKANNVLSPDAAALATTLIQIGGTVGGLLLARPMDSKGFLPVTVLFAVAVPSIAAIGYFATISQTGVLVAAFCSGFAVLGLQFGLNAASAMIYPTHIRSNGSGWAFGIGRFGSILGPIPGGYLVARHLPLWQLFLIWTIPSIVGLLAALALTLLYRVRFKGLGLGQREALEGGV